MMMDNPQMRALMDANPQLAHVLNDPDTLRQSLNLARNPALMQELMRNQDRQMANIEAHPEGFNALRRMYETVQEPMLDALTASATATSTSASTSTSSSASSASTSASTSGSAAAPANPNTAALPNPWATQSQGSMFSAPNAGAASGGTGAGASAGGAAPNAGAAFNPFAAFGGAGANPFAAMNNPMYVCAAAQRVCVCV
jgi:ubiquilin